MSKFSKLRNALTLQTTRFTLWWCSASQAQRTMVATAALMGAVLVVVLGFASAISLFA